MTAATVHINRPDGLAVRRIAHCPTCDCRRRFTGVDQLWYGPTWTCLNCGDRWSDGHRLDRPFRPGWRRESRRNAQETWGLAVRLFGPEHRRWLCERTPTDAVGEGIDLQTLADDTGTGVTTEEATR